MKSTLLATLATLSLSLAANAGSLYDIPLKDIDGKDASLKKYEGKVMLIVNVASQCGLTPQYAGLEKLFETYRAQGLQVLVKAAFA